MADNWEAIARGAQARIQELEAECVRRADLVMQACTAVDKARDVIRAGIEADRIDCGMGYPLPGESALYTWFALTVDPYMAEPALAAASAALEGEPPKAGDTIPFFCSACGKKKPNDAAWARPVMGCECGNAVWTGTVTLRG